MDAPRTALVLFGTETGTAQDFAYEISRILERHRFETDVEEFDHVTPQSMTPYALVVFVLSTTGQGEFPSNARKFWTSLRRKKLTSTFLMGVSYAIVGLGDTSYPKFNYAARMLHKRVRQLGADSLLIPCEADEQGEDSTDGAFLAWSILFKSMLSSTFPLASGVELISEQEPVPSKWTLDALAGDNSSHASPDLLQAPSSQSHGQSFSVNVVQNKRVTPETHWQDVRHIKLSTDQTADYYPGDVIAIRPLNQSSDVEALIRLMEWNEIADAPIRFKAHRARGRTTRFLEQFVKPTAPLSLRHLLHTSLDISAIPRRSFFAALAQYTDDEMQKERLLEFTDPQYLDEYYDYATRPRRSIVEVLQEFDTVKIPWQEAINVFPVLRPRQFSIASGGDSKHGGATFELLVAIVRYRTIIRRIREGVCTRYLSTLSEGSSLDVTLKTEGRLQPPGVAEGTAHLLVGAGTGIAPLRAVIQEKEARTSSPTTLIFGCRNAEADYFFKDEWLAISKATESADKHRLQVITAFSRDQKQKVYVQDRIRQHAEVLRKLILEQRAVIVVCGSSGPMPKAIRQAFVDILGQGQSSHSADNAHSINDAEQLLTQMEKEGRYKQETW